MEGVDRLNELNDEILVNNIMSRLDCTTKELIRTTATISKRWKNLWTQLPHLIFSYEDDITDFGSDDTDLCDYISSRANSWIRYAISRNVEDVDLWLWDGGVRQDFTYDDELFFNNLCFTRIKLSDCLFNPPNGAISWERLKCLCLCRGTLDEDMIEKILSGSPCLESLELNDCYGYRRIDVTSKSVKKLVFFVYDSNAAYEDDYIDCIKINAPYISSLTIKGELVLREFVLLNVSSLVEVDLKYWISYEEFEIFAKKIFRGLLESLGHVKDITFGDHCSELLSRLKAGSDTSDDD
ncbi:ribonuclease H-like domain-containing protein [Tanacetum coccineum]